ncbi:MAG: helix-turn-helix domain-containing protein [Kiritimatiellae bacterium]|jgi:cytoskeletal protein RodZ|nr:helix-turn-helix domain-containing protein [Kiritimatiellia bacterium]
MSLGNILKSAREEKGLSPTDVAEQTNMMVQIVQELENEDFHRIAAPIYGRGFLKLYAELLEIDVQPLIDEFMDIYSGKAVPELRKRELERPDVQETPVPRAIQKEELSEPNVNIPQRVEIVPAPAVKNLDVAPKALPQIEVSDESAAEIFSEPVAVESQLAEDDSAPVVISAPVSASVESVAPEPTIDDEQVVPEVSDGLFDSDEPNLFNTTPLQERIAEARRLMDENSVSEKKETGELHIGTNQKLPIFQIGGRMDKSYESEIRTATSKVKFKRLLDSFLSGFNSFIEQLCDRLPFDLNKKSFYIYGLLGLIVIVFMVVGITALFKLTAPVGESTGEDVAVVEKFVKEQPVRPIPVADLKIPPPPDMYFD